MRGQQLLGAAEPQPFDLFAELPAGTTLLEASAGTGKTFTIAALATRYVAEGRAELGELLLVTFGRAATSELRERVRERLSSTLVALAGPDPRSSVDPLVAHLAAVDPAELARRVERLARAGADFDAATIATTHAFCQQMLTRLGVLADRDADTVMMGDVAELADEIVDDLYLARYAESDQPALEVAQAREVGRVAVTHRLARLAPDGAAPGSPAAHRYDFARDVLAELAARKRDRRVLDYDDLLVLLAEALTHPVIGPAAAARVRDRFRVVLVDEFQDTDPVQWQILRTAFHGHATLVLIGDPKQAVYAFRGGDVVTYLAAAADADRVATLPRNYRSASTLVTGLDHLLAGAALGDERIVVRPVQGRDDVPAGDAPVRLRHVTRTALGVRGTGNAPVADVRELVAADVASQVVERLRAGAAAHPGEVAVLTRSNNEAQLVHAALSRVGVGAVVSGLTSVFATSAATQWQRLLDALEQPGHSARTAALALTDLVGWSAARLAGADEADRDRLADRVRGWALTLDRHGVGALSERLWAGGVAERVAARPDGERLLTDLRHVGEALARIARADGLGVAALAAELRERIAEAGDDLVAEDRARRLETDRSAVQVLTVHASKGLEFPVVMVPFAWNRFEPTDPPVLHYHDDDGHRVVHVGGPGSDLYGELRLRHLAEERGEDLRLLYVALTRARSEVVAWWAPSRNSVGSALSRVLLGDYAVGEVPPDVVRLGRDGDVATRLAALEARSGGTVRVEQVDAAPPPQRWVAPAAAVAPISVGPWQRQLDETWRRLSYTALSAVAHERAAVTEMVVEPEDPGSGDEPPPVLDVDDASGGRVDGDGAGGAGPVSCPLGDLPAGAAFGTLVHGILEEVDPGGETDLDGALRRAALRLGARQLLGVGGPGARAVGSGEQAVGAGELDGGSDAPGDAVEVLVSGLRVALATPLGPLAGGVRLDQVAARDRLCELEFELPLAGGDDDPGKVRRPARLADLAALLAAHLPPDDVLAGYPDRLADLGRLGGDQVLHGYLTGSLDAVLRVGPPDAPRYLVVDYKTNRLAPPGEPLTVAHYAPGPLRAAMVEAHYPLQLLLYLVALHRFLRWRQPGYDPERHLGGGLYLFVRGMVGGGAAPTGAGVAGAPPGVFGWRPPAAFVVELSRLLAGGAR